MLESLKQYQEINQATFARKGYIGLNFFGKIKFTQILLQNKNKLYQFERLARKNKECYIGPFIGEFGNFLLHILPYLSHLSSQGIKVHYCGLELHRPFLKNNDGEDFLTSFVNLRDFFKEVKPSGNNIKKLPYDVEEKISNFIKEAKSSQTAFLDIFNDQDLYWYSFRNWQLNNRQFIYDLSKVYSTIKEDKVVVFPRKMTKEFTPNNGGRWNYNELGEKLALHFKEVVFVGHPELSDSKKSENSNIRYAVTGDNKDVLLECATAKLIVTQHSGAMHVGAYVRTPVLLIFKGLPPIKGLDDSIRFRKNFTFNKVDIAFNEKEVLSYLYKNKDKIT